jgi:hypothetical protein
LKAHLHLGKPGQSRMPLRTLGHVAACRRDEVRSIVVRQPPQIVVRLGAFNDASRPQAHLGISESAGGEGEGGGSLMYSLVLADGRAALAHHWLEVSSLGNGMFLASTVICMGSNKSRGLLLLFLSPFASMSRISCSSDASPYLIRNPRVLRAIEG